MPLTRIIRRDRYGRGPIGPLAVSVTAIRQAGLAGFELRLADDPPLARVRILGHRAQLGPCKGLLGDAALDVDVDELAGLATVARAWRARRIALAAHVHALGGPIPYRAPAWRYSPRSWQAERVEGDLDARETTYRVEAVEHAAGSWALPIEVELRNGMGELVGVALRTSAERCAVLTRGSVGIFRSWPTSGAGFLRVARLLVGATSERGDIAFEDAVEFDASGAFVLEESVGGRVTQVR